MKIYRPIAGLTIENLYKRVDQLKFYYYENYCKNDSACRGICTC